ncbi:MULTISPECIES: TIGR02221 family CRISPR-associated protein [unclassified Candidatus Frackibacter]|uniref:TIGR02221 family CRISPR-associated protein n=1 Tax=unclassified Candidatus Frackibacter TaxID=2648818 RepID=UPI00088243D8|nr:MULTISPECIES: TIGR02221 family CRISPR-associated protein [unclassified Candidatus Frackibacter]SDC25933.1 CRISPR-associated protein, TM1812 family [Candidatus Frackibacter sp. WG11]SEM52899.1 CRISPR-associated protein, TM1812 family [Candidatus Frackibacter sp. WG12]SFL55544.1 CRISPR-associated protein, TM1812 family [Candidatus Frackibacter sp. WG13]
MAKVLMSPLGAGYFDESNNNPLRQYRTAKYKFDGDENEYETSFVAAALAKYLEVDKIVIVGTQGSMWEEVYRYYFKASHSKQEIDLDYYCELVEKIEVSNSQVSMIDESDLNKVTSVIDEYLVSINSDAQGGSSCHLIHYGLSEEELWNNFDIFMQLIDELEDGDEIYLDITHAFRSIPLFMYLMMDFIQTLGRKRIKLAGIYYGMLEVKKELGYTQVVDLKPLFDISKLIRGVYDFTNYGNGYLISDLINSRQMSRDIKYISELVNINYLVDLKNRIKSLKESLENKDLSEIKKGLKYILPQLQNFIDRFNNLESDAKFQLEIAGWYFDNTRYANGYICLTEAFLTKLCEIYGVDPVERSERRMMAFLLDNYTRFKKDISEQKSWNIFERLATMYKNIKEIRHRIAHGSLESKGVFSNDIRDSAEYYEEVSNLLNSDILKKINSYIKIDKLKKVNTYS